MAALLRRFDCPLVLPPPSDQVMLANTTSNHAAVFLAKRYVITLTIKYSWDIIEACVNHAPRNLAKWVLEFKPQNPESGLILILFLSKYVLR
jgi:hypothetical protein